MALNKVIGNKGQLPWHYKSELAFFKRTTINNYVVMGRKTYDAVGCLPHRTNIVLSSNVEECCYSPKENVLYTNDPTYPISLSDNGYDVFIIGGSSLYELYLKEYSDYIDRCYLSILSEEFDGDAYFPYELLIEKFPDYELLEKLDGDIDVFLHKRNN